MRDSSNQLQYHSTQVRQRQIEKLSTKEYQRLAGAARKYANDNFPGSFERLKRRLKLDENAAFVAFITDIFANTKVTLQVDSGNFANRKQDSCLLLDRFIALLL